MELIAVKTGTDSLKLHPKTIKEIEKHDPQTVYNNRINMANSAAERNPRLAEGLRKEARKIKAIYGL